MIEHAGRALIRSLPLPVLTRALYFKVDIRSVGVEFGKVVSVPELTHRFVRIHFGNAAQLLLVHLLCASDTPHVGVSRDLRE